MKIFIVGKMIWDNTYEVPKYTLYFIKGFVSFTDAKEFIDSFPKDEDIDYCIEEIELVGTEK